MSHGSYVRDRENSSYIETNISASLVTAKYLPRSNLWSSKREYQCSIFWKSIMRLRGRLAPLVSWNLGSGNTCHAIGQPWFPGGTDYSPENTQQRNMLVSDLLAHDQTGWDNEKLEALFGLTGCLSILSSVRPPDTTDREDILVLKLTTSGGYSVKKMYDAITNPPNRQGIEEKELSQAIWKKGSIQPRLRMFMWKCSKNALPLSQVQFRRLSKGDPACALCGGEESMLHMLFTCPFARLCWFMGPYVLKSDALQGSVSQIFRSLADQLNDEQWSTCVNMMRSIWRCRNEKSYAGKTPTPTMFK